MIEKLQNTLLESCLPARNKPNEAGPAPQQDLGILYIWYVYTYVHIHM